jgi:DNA (cytosine-5)-methyltransferase 1
MPTICDCFCGAGGSSTGAVAANYDLLWAGNHDPVATAVHAANHPTAEHACADLMEIDWRDVPRPDVLWASPSCQPFSKAASLGGNGKRGSAPAHAKLRSNAWAVIAAAEALSPDLVVIENVEEFVGWKCIGAWRHAWRDLGFQLGEHSWNAADSGCPQSRKRIFIIASRSVAPLRLNLEKREHVPFRECIDEDAGGWRSVSECASGVQERVAKARRNHPRGLVLSQYVTGHPGRSLDRPIGTVTTKLQWALVRRARGGDEIRFLNSLELKRAMSFPDDYKLVGNTSADCSLLGNAVAPIQAQAILEELRRVG